MSAPLMLPSFRSLPVRLPFLTSAPVTLPSGVDPDAVVAATHTDKKSRGGTVRYSLPMDIGTIATASGGFTVAVPDAAVRRILT